MKQDGPAADDAPSPESIHEVRLEALLHNLVEREGKMRAAQMLGVNYKTVARSIESGRLSVHLREALMARLFAQAEDDAGQPDEARTPEPPVGALVEELRGCLDELRETVEEGLRALREEQARRMGALAGRLAQVESGLGVRVAAERPVGAERSPQGGGTSSRPQFRRTNPSVVTMEPQAGDEEVYGEAWPLVDEWRKLRESHPSQGRGLSWLVNEERLRELEVVLVGEHELTMPPDTDPWDSLSRRTQVRWRRETIERLRGERVRAQIGRWIRRVLTLGLWRN